MLLMFKYLLTNLKKRNIFLTYHAIAVVLFTFIYFIIARYIGVTGQDHEKLGNEKKIINFNKLKDRGTYGDGNTYKDDGTIDENEISYGGWGAFKNCLKLAINTQTGVAYGFHHLPVSSILVTLVHIQIIIAFLLLNI